MGNIINPLLEDLDAFLQLSKEEIGKMILQELIIHEKNKHTGQLRRGNYCLQYSSYPEIVGKKISEAWKWIDINGFIAPQPKSISDGEWIYVTDDGKKIVEDEDFFITFKYNRFLPKDMLLPIFIEQVWPLYIRGDYDTAIFQALKIVEVKVRKESGLTDKNIGVKLIRKAFDVAKGPLTDSSIQEAERQAKSDLFAGSIGYYKNPQSHREVDIQDPIVAAEIIIIANHLLRITKKETFN